MREKRRNGERLLPTHTLKNAAIMRGKKGESTMSAEKKGGGGGEINQKEEETGTQG